MAVARPNFRRKSRKPPIFSITRAGKGIWEADHVCRPLVSTQLPRLRSGAGFLPTYVVGFTENPYFWVTGGKQLATYVGSCWATIAPSGNKKNLSFAKRITRKTHLIILEGDKTP